MQGFGVQEERPLVRPKLNDKYRDESHFYAKTRASLLSVGIVKPAQGVSAEVVNEYLKNEAAPANACKLNDQDRTDVARFLNRYALAYCICAFAEDVT